MKKSKMIIAVFSLLIMTTMGFTKVSPENFKNLNPNTMFYHGYFTVDTDVVISIYSATSGAVGTVTYGAFGINVGGPFFSATGHYNATLVSSFHMVADGNTYEYSGPIQH